MEMEIIMMIIFGCIAFAIAVCGIMLTIERSGGAPHTFAENVKVYEPMIQLPPYFDARAEGGNND